ncbi:hypothetical protein [Nocardia sp. CDC160]|uniref:hypothetical protein n=1 Tax=Nocardia sp. CDC160 TaxID=3112166 RepID=UPI002DBC1A92|nr:hypothetical protein [Nocardia sp. CDC160]MEC3919376.1 hypothetical protein [Nocardia sp. CDC160]
MTSRAETVLAVEDGIDLRHIRLSAPLPAGFPEHPAGLNDLHYLRYRSETGPTESADADAIVVMHPGTWAGAQSLDRLARNVVRAAAAQGRSIEWWSIARRSEGSTDLTGIHAVYAADDPGLAIDYYFHGKPVGGKHFEGFRGRDRQGFLAELGLRGVVEDQHELLVRELPDPEIRRAKVFLGGHSLGGLMAGAYAAWDFDGVPGHEQCAGLIAIDTLVGTDPLNLHRFPRLRRAAGSAHTAVLAGLRRGLIPASTPPGGTALAKMWTLIYILAVAAACEAEVESDVLRRLPDTVGWETLLRVLGARRYRDLLRRHTSVRELRLTGAAAFGLAVGTPHLPIDALTSTMGNVSGPTAPRTTFPVPRAAHRIPVLRKAVRATFGEPTVVPADPTTLYRWRPGGSADLGQLAHTLAAGPLATFEAYFPMRVHYDLWTALAGANTDDLAGHRHAAGAARLPTLHVLGDRDSLVPFLLRASRLMPPERSHATGYRHIDMVTGIGPDGEPVSTAITDFLVAHTIPTVTRESA